MGHTVEKPLAELGRDDVAGDARIIDYATTCRSDFMDIYLSAHCRFFLGNNSGLFVVSSIFDRPVALANFFPIGMMPFHEFDYLIPKFLRDTKTGAILPYWRLQTEGFFAFYEMFETSLHQSHGYEWVEHDSEDILNLAKDMVSRLEGGSSSTRDKGKAIAAYFKEKYQGSVPGQHLAGGMAPSFALRHRRLIER